MYDLLSLKIKAAQIRKKLLQMIYQAKTGHTGGSLSCVDILVSLYFGVMRIDPKNPHLPDRDRFVMSKGHSVEALYAVLAQAGFFSEDELGTYCAFNSRLTGHPTTKVPGVEVNTGALGHGLAVGVGMALAGKIDKKNYKVYVLMGDGELDEGSVWEAAQVAAHYKLDNLIAIVDRNKLQISGFTEEVVRLENLEKKWESFGWKVLQVDGHDIDGLIDVFKSIPTAPYLPHIVIAHTVKGKGVSFIENKKEWHHHVPSEEELRKAMEELDKTLQELRNDA
ncbi:transketolase [Pseudothermotoga sp. U03pept]|uniref:transketolase n=1 Tax=Pseudothermotoga sp. U03pept TaxID=3447012 RepID=UPI003F04E605